MHARHLSQGNDWKQQKLIHFHSHCLSFKARCSTIDNNICSTFQIKTTTQQAKLKHDWRQPCWYPYIGGVSPSLLRIERLKITVRSSSGAQLSFIAMSGCWVNETPVSLGMGNRYQGCSHECFKHKSLFGKQGHCFRCCWCWFDVHSTFLKTRREISHVNDHFTAAWKKNACVARIHCNVGITFIRLDERSQVRFSAFTQPWREWRSGHERREKLKNRSWGVVFVVH